MPSNQTPSNKCAKYGMYKPVWEKIKTSPGNSVTVQCNRPDLVARIRKGVITEKYKDIGFKLINEREYFWLDIVYDEDRKQLKFTLRKRYDLENIVT